MALDEPDKEAVLRFLRSALPESDSTTPGLRNEGLLATHELRTGVLARPDWAEATRLASTVAGLRGPDLMRALGFALKPLPGPVSLLMSGERGEKRTAIAVFLDRSEQPEVASERFTGCSPVSYALAKADEEGLPFVVVSTGAAVRLYPVRPGVGVGRRGRPETFVELHLELLAKEHLGYLWLLLSSQALQPGGTFEQIAESSGRYAADLGRRLRDRIYSGVVWRLATAIAHARKLRSPRAADLAETYRATLTLLFRLLFIAYAEDKDLLPYRTNGRYRDRSLKHMAHELRAIKAEGRTFDPGTSYWDEAKRLFHAVDKGQKEWDVPPYNGGMFSPSPEVNSAGPILDGVSLGNDYFGEALAQLLLDETEDEDLGPVDFRSLGVREFGTIYEGLLECELSVATTDLTLDKDGRYRPVKSKKDKVEVAEGAIYLHDRSGSRKASGSYYTKDFAVEHLLQHALEPALDEHLARLDALKDPARASKAFFDFRVADIAMGSGHFLVAAVDHVERRFSGYLARNPLPGVMAELKRLRESAQKALGAEGSTLDIEDTQLLRRLIARRCIFGVDLNPTAVDLARLSIWIHSFVPGLPLSFLDRNLVVGNSLVGIAQFSDATPAAGEGLLFVTTYLHNLLERGRKSVEALSSLSDADLAEVDQARMAGADLDRRLAPLRAVFDILTASRHDERVAIEVKEGRFQELVKDADGIQAHALARRAAKVLATVRPLHFPTAFPEVFRSDRAGFDVIVGNPPWEEATIEEDDFWTRYVPGFQGFPQVEQERLKARLRRDRPDLVEKLAAEVAAAASMRGFLTAGGFPGMGTGDPDLYKAFCWRFWALARKDGGRIGVVLPRAAFSGKGTAEFRRMVLATGRIARLTFVLNTGFWVFEGADNRGTSGLVAFERKPPSAEEAIAVLGPFTSMSEFEVGIQLPPQNIPVEGVKSWTDTWSLPALPSKDSLATFLQIRKAPRLDSDDGASWLVKPYRELDATNDKGIMTFAEVAPDGFVPIYKGESFNIWCCDTGTYYGWANPKELVPFLAEREEGRRFNQQKVASGKQVNIPYNTARIAFRDVSNCRNERTLIAALLPPRVTVTNKGPCLARLRGDESDEAYLLGILCSLSLDWYSRRFVEKSMSLFIFNPLPVPRVDRADARWKRVVCLAGRLACPDRRFRRWAEAVGVEFGPLKDDAKKDMIAELDAVAASLYGLSEPQLVHVFQTFHGDWDFQPRLEAVLGHFRAWSKRA